MSEEKWASSFSTFSSDESENLQNRHFLDAIQLPAITLHSDAIFEIPLTLLATGGVGRLYSLIESQRGGENSQITGVGASAVPLSSVHLTGKEFLIGNAKDNTLREGILGFRYEIISQLGQGTFASIWKARGEYLNLYRLWKNNLT